MFFEPNNSCMVLNYVKTHFQCNTRDLVDPGYTRNFPVLTLPIPGDDGNNDLPDEDGPYNENDRKPIWWYHSDHLGSSTYLTDNFGRPSHYYETLPFGEMIVEHNQSSFYDNKWKFNGKELDAATGMYYYGARYYDPRISIFVSVDPLAEETMTPYQYASNNPIMKVDPTGMEDHDYRLKEDGKLELIRETDDSTHTIYNEYNTQSFTFNADEIVGNNGKNLSNLIFSEMETLFSSGFQVYQFTNPDTAEGFYRYAANFSNVEFGKFDGYFGSDYGGFVFTSNKEMTVSNTGLAKRLSNLGYEGARFSHSHPNGTQFPSGYEGVKSLENLYLQPNLRDNRGDRINSMYINSLPGFENTVHEVYSPIHNTFTRYYGNNRAENPTKRSYFDSN